MSYLDKAKKQALEIIPKNDQAKAFAMIAIAEELKQLNFILDLILQQLQGGIVTYKRD